MKAIDRAVEHFKQKPVKRIEVPEWGDEQGPLVIFANPITLREQSRLSKVDGGDAEMLIEVLVMKALDGHGEKLFALDDKPKLRSSADPLVVAKIVSQIMAQPQETLEKN
jgi:hypothetical protein